MLGTIISGGLQLASSFGIGYTTGAIVNHVLPATVKPAMKVCCTIGACACGEVAAVHANKWIDNTVKETGKAIEELKELIKKAKEEKVAKELEKKLKEEEVDENIVEEVEEVEE